MRLFKRGVVALGALALIVGGMSAPTQAATAAVMSPPSPSMAKVAKATKPAPTTAKLKGPKGRPGGVGTMALTPCSPACYDYAGGGQLFTDAPHQTSISMPITKPYLAKTASPDNNDYQNDSHTLAELSGADGAGNIVEIGSMVNPSINGGSNDPYLFVYSWIAGAPQCYNACGFVDLSGNPGYSPVGPGDSINSAVGTSKLMGIAYFDSVGCPGCAGWWMAYNSLYIGYYPDALWSAASPTPQVFVDMAQVQAFGEVAKSNIESCSDMGNGIFGGTAGAATFTGFFASGTTDTINLGNVVTNTRPTAWSRGTATSNSVPFGGPGFNSIGVVTGTAGSCAPGAQGTPTASAFQGWKQACPDNQAVTGCDSAFSKTWASAVVGTCYTVPVPGTTVINAVWNNSGSAKTFQIFRTIGCTSTVKTYTNGQKEVFLPGSGWDGTSIRSYKRTV